MEDKKSYINRLSRLEGQIWGISKMLEEDRSCQDVVTQLSAVKAGIDKVMALMVTENLLTCVAEENTEDQREKVEQALKLIFKSR
ncbi:metal-sensitive transcriptional regulator [Proteiniclasticum ruminis]|uniref:DNA-binding transcriptional regulator, FrmR family n=1 Tax=Proteiniclasticum ruminis TaxID=398199 RepID=A0A1G8SMP3_9CLOT|nr:metal-sensing transcriptional repressor [Proteiniclasticum ruminis]SDJ30519.1 DNA-binding transcriptional regulator, FrmR family [Proteiniclasticum ruminis]